MDWFVEIDRLSFAARLLISFLSLVWTGALLMRRPRVAAHYILAYLIFTSGLIVVLHGWAFRSHELAALFAIPVLRWINAPLVFFLIRFQMPNRLIFKPALLFHFIPAVVLLVILVGLGQSSSAFDAWASWRILYIRPLTFTLTGVYIALALVAIRRAIRIQRQSQAGNLGPKQKWVILVFVCALGFWIGDLLELILFPTEIYPYLIGYVARIVALGVLTAYAIKSSRVFSDESVYLSQSQNPLEKVLMRALELAEARSNDPLSLSKTGLSDEAIRLEGQNLLDTLRASREFLDPDFKLLDLARLAKRPAYQTSEIINRGLKMNFFELANSLRIEEAKALLKSQEKTVIEIAYATGYNSKSAFNTAFKRWAEMTPTEYRHSTRLT